MIESPFFNSTASAAGSSASTVVARIRVIKLPVNRMEASFTSRSAWLFRTEEKRQQIDELLLGQAFLQSLGHRARRLLPLRLDLRPGDDVLARLAIHERDGRIRFGNLDTFEGFSVFQF